MQYKTVIQAIVAAYRARENCARNGNADWQERWSGYLARLCQELPSGSGFDSGTTLETVSASKVVLSFSYHHMNEVGYYTHWTEHKAIVIPAWEGFDIRITGRNTRDGSFKDFAAETFHLLLSQDAPAANFGEDK